MKKVLFTALIAALWLGFSSCGDDFVERHKSGNIVGTWELSRLYYLEKFNGNKSVEDNLTPTTDQPTTVYFSVQKDGAITGPLMPLRLDVNTFRWELSGDKLRITPKNKNVTAVWKVEKLTSDQLTVSMTEYYTDDIGVYDILYQQNYRRVSRN
jgi:hypothetical protein